MCLSLLHLLRLPMQMLPRGLSSAVRFWVSIDRISKFLNARYESVFENFALYRTVYHSMFNVSQ